MMVLSHGISSKVYKYLFQVTPAGFLLGRKPPPSILQFVCLITPLHCPMNEFMVLQELTRNGIQKLQQYSIERITGNRRYFGIKVFFVLFCFIYSTGLTNINQTTNQQSHVHYLLVSVTGGGFRVCLLLS